MELLRLRTSWVTFILVLFLIVLVAHLGFMGVFPGAAGCHASVGCIVSDAVQQLTLVSVISLVLISAVAGYVLRLRESLNGRVRLVLRLAEARGNQESSTHRFSMCRRVQRRVDADGCCQMLRSRCE